MSERVFHPERLGWFILHAVFALVGVVSLIVGDFVEKPALGPGWAGAATAMGYAGLLKAKPLYEREPEATKDGGA